MKMFNMWAVRSFVVALSLAVFSPTAFGDYDNGAIVSMKLTNGGSPNFEIGPYPALINGADVARVICDSYSAHTAVNTTYQFQVHTLDSLGGTKWKTQFIDYEARYFQAAWLSGQLLDLNQATYSAANCYNAVTFAACKSDIQYAIWDTFEENLRANSTAQNSWNWRVAASAATASFNAADYRILTPHPLTLSGAVPANPQEFIIRTPEGSALALLGVNMLGLVGLIRVFRRRRSI